MIKKFLSLLAAGVLFSSSLFAQELTAESVTALRHYKAGDNWFFGIQGGGTFPFMENSFRGNIGKEIGYGGQIYVGKFFNPTLGFRIAGGYNNLVGTASMKNQSGSENGEYDYYRYHSANGYLDALVNLNSLFGHYSETAKVNVNAIMGVGYNYAWGYDDKVNSYYKYYVEDASHHLMAVRVGLQLAVKLSDAIDLTVEATGHVGDDKLNGKLFRCAMDSYGQGLVGITYHFKDHFGDRRMKYETYTDADKVADLNNQVSDLRRQLAEASKEKVKNVEEVNSSKDLSVRIHYMLDKYKVDAAQTSLIATTAQYLKDNPNATATITGYADQKTGVPVYNQYIAQRRADTIKDMLVNNYKVDASRLTVVSKGDTEQPYANENDWNRVAVITFSE